MPAPSQQQPTPAPIYRNGIIKEVKSGQSVIIHRPPTKDTPEKNMTLYFDDITAPRLGKISSEGEVTKDEPYAWEAREFLRKLILRKTVMFTATIKEESSNGTIYYPDKDNSVTELLVSKGLVEVRRTSNEKLNQLQQAAKANRKGKWSDDPKEKHIRPLKLIKNAEKFVKDNQNKPFKAVIEHVQTGSIVRITLLPDFYSTNLHISGIKCPNVKSAEPWSKEAQQFVEHRLLQRDVEVYLETTYNTQIYGSIKHPAGNIAEELLKEGLATCDDMTICHVHGNSAKFRQAEREAKSKKLRKWENWESSAPRINEEDKEFTAVVTEISWDALRVKLPDGSYRKIHFSSIRFKRGSQKEQEDRKKQDFFLDDHTRYDIFDFLRKRLIGKEVSCTVDYIQSSPDGKLPDKQCCTVTVGGVNIAKALVQKGLAQVVYSRDEENRSPAFDELKRAEIKAGKDKEKDKDGKSGPRPVRNYCGDVTRTKSLLNSLIRNHTVEGIIMFVSSGARFRIYLLSESVTVNFVLAGISCPRTKFANSDSDTAEEPFAEEALAFVKDKIMQREVEVRAENIDKYGNIIGWLWINKENLSVSLVEEGFADVHDSGRKSEYNGLLESAKKRAVDKKLRRWENYVEEEDTEPIKEDRSAPMERKVDYKTVCVVETTPDLQFYAFPKDREEELEAYHKKLNQELENHASLSENYKPRRGEMVAARFPPKKGPWYRAKFEKVSGNNAQIFYIDYGNKTNINLQTQRASLCPLPGAYLKDEPYSSQYGVACASLPPSDYVEDSLQDFREYLMQDPIKINTEYFESGIPFVTIKDAKDEDPIKHLIAEGFLRFKSSRDRRLEKLIQEYSEAQEKAKKNHLGSWEYGDNTEDDAKEFGLGK